MWYNTYRKKERQQIKTEFQVEDIMDKWIFKKTDLSWIVDYDYERSACTCDEPYVCRCTTIERAWVESINVKLVIASLTANVSPLP